MEQVGRKGAVLFVNDSKATNADSSAQALACFGDMFWIAGGKPKTGGITSLAPYFPRIRKAYLIGEAAADFAATLDGRVAHEIVGTLARAVAAAARDAEAAGLAEAVVLLSPEFRIARRPFPRIGSSPARSHAASLSCHTAVSREQGANLPRVNRLETMARQD
jgi:UDP-N-acetylmuramoylalanine--D-glutamate ligase